MTDAHPRCKYLVLDSGPLLSLSPLRGLAETYLTVPQVLDELKDKRAREHFEKLGLSTGVRVNVQNPDPASLSQVIQFAKKTGDYAVLSHADICVLALTHSLHEQEKALLQKQREETKSETEAAQSSIETPNGGDTHGSNEGPSLTSAPNDSALSDHEPQATELQDLNNDAGAPTNALSNLSLDDPSEASHHDDEAEDQERIPLDAEVDDEAGADQSTSENDDTPKTPSDDPLYDDPSSEDDGEGEWITPQNVALHKSRALDLLPSSGGDRKKGKKGTDDEPVLAGCMTADFAMQNVLLQMGLTLVGTEGRRIQKVKSWVLRCHACFKICKDNSKQFCPSCGNPALMRASVTIASPNASADAPVMEIHLKKNFQYKIRGSKYSIPAPKPGSAKTGPGEGLILREDQTEYMRAKKRVEGKREREEQKMIKGLVDRGGEGGVAVGSWADPDWIPGILGGPTKGLSTRSGDGMPKIGFGRKNPNERKKHK